MQNKKQNKKQKKQDNKIHFWSRTDVHLATPESERSHFYEKQIETAC